MFNLYFINIIEYFNPSANFIFQRFVMIIMLVMFAFSAGLNQLYWYYAHIGNEKCLATIFDTAEDKEECFFIQIYYLVITKKFLILLKIMF